MKTLMNMKIRTKLMLSFTVLVAITLIIGYLSISNLKLFSQKEKALYEGNLVPITQLTGMTNYFQRIRVNIGDIILSNSDEDIKQNKITVSGYDAKIQKLIADFEPSVSSDSEKVAFNNFKRDYQNYLSNSDKVSELVTSGQKEKAQLLLNNELNPTAKSAQNQLSTLVRINNNEGIGEYRTDSSEANTIIWTLSGFLLAGIVISFFLAVYISRSISSGNKSNI